VLVACLVPTAGLALAARGIALDVENDAMKSVDTDEARDARILEREFGREAVILVDFQALPVGSGRITELETAALRELAEKVAELPGVDSLRPWPEPSVGSRVWVLTLDDSLRDYAREVEGIEREIRDGAPSSLRVAIAGQPVAEVVIAHEVRSEQRRILPWVLGGLVALLFAYYRHPGLVAAVVGPSLAGIAWTTGTYGLLGHEHDPISVLLQPVLLTVGIASGVHWVESYLDELAAGRAPRAAAREALRALRRPAMLAAVTTVIGFLSLLGNAIPAVSSFGAFAALGVGLTFLLASLLTPVLLELFAARVRPEYLARRGATSGELAVRAARRLLLHARAIRAGSVVLAVACSWAWTQVTVDNDPLRILPADHPFRRESAALASEIGGTEVVHVLVPAPSRLAEPVALGLFAGAVAAEPGVAGPAGPALRAANGDWRLSFLLRPGGSAARTQVFAAIERRAAALSAPDARAAGIVVQIARDSEHLVRSTLWGTGGTALVLFVTFWIGLRSLHFAWLAMVPNLLPCIVMYGGMALLGRPLSVATAMIGSILLGLVVDDTIHLLYRFRDRVRQGAEPVDALEHVFRHSGRAIAITSIVLGVGFGLAALGSLTSTVEFGLLAAATIGIASLCDLVLLPAILVRLEAVALVPARVRHA
jgi:hypothetical protein